MHPTLIMTTSCVSPNGMAVSGRKIEPHAVLKAEQRDASDPAQHVWLSASAGTGKTYVLSARVLRLLLRGVKPDAILCLTFTKAGAAEMAERVHARLAHWVQIKDTELAAELRALDENFGPDQVAKARTLFATVLESRGGGLRIMTIHAFCQTLLAGFPLEAGIAPGFRPLEGREEAALVQTVLAELVIQAEREGDTRLLGDLRALSLRMGEAEAVAFLKWAARAIDALEILGPGLEAKVRVAMAVPLDHDPSQIVEACADGAFDRASLLALCDVLNDWGTVRARERVELISNWLLAPHEIRAVDLSKLMRAWCKADGTLFGAKGWVPVDPRYDEIIERLDAWCRELTSLAARAELAADVTAALGAALRYARAYADAKRSRGLVDFDDQIQLTRKLLVETGMGDWIRYKLDQATDHILVDESQDTNRAQWEIVEALADEFWAGEGSKPDKLRTIFAVGDYKQAIYGFQGTDPQHYKRAGLQFELKALNAGQELRRLSLDQSFRSSPPVLDVVDALLRELGAEALGLEEASALHRSFRGGAGEVLLLPPVTAEHAAEDEGEEGWIPSATRDLATKLAKQVKAWLDEPAWLSAKGRTLTPGDVMILVRKRSDIAPLLVARLHEEGVPVAGVDRLKLQAPLAVQDLLAAMRFGAQPQDDLNLAALLVSPLIGWSQDDLFTVANGRAGVLWDAVPAGEARDALGDMLSAADNITPYAFLENLLSGALQGRKKLLRRLGEEARDPVDELLNAALQYEREGVASLQQFLDWFDRGETEVVRDAGAAGDAVRVMTVHGAKGLQAPLVILADACADPEKAQDRNFKWTIEGVVNDLPIPKPRGAERALVASLAASMDEIDDKAKKEHWRLLYVAMTRAEERLVIAGSLGPRAKGVVPEESWHAAVERAMMRLDTAKIDDPNWGAASRYGQAFSASSVPLRENFGSGSRRGAEDAERNRFALPAWLNQSAPQEARPPRPLAPSSIGQDDVANPPPSAAMAAAAERGRNLHALFERLPALPLSERRAAGARWLAAEGADASLVDVALRVIDDPQFADIFAPGALSEAPVAGVVDGIVIAGTVDRLCVTDTSVEIIDFKTGRRVPATSGDVPVQHLRQMAAYAAVLQGIFPDHEIRTSLLYSEGPTLLRLPPDLLALHKPSFAAAQDNLVTAG
jgi:ATP-dependent helicase/nuclease subunit A